MNNYNIKNIELREYADIVDLIESGTDNLLVKLHINDIHRCDMMLYKLILMAERFNINIKYITRRDYISMNLDNIKEYININNIDEKEFISNVNRIQEVLGCDIGAYGTIKYDNNLNSLLFICDDIEKFITYNYYRMVTIVMNVVKDIHSNNQKSYSYSPSNVMKLYKYWIEKCPDIFQCDNNLLTYITKSGKYLPEIADMLHYNGIRFVPVFKNKLASEIILDLSYKRKETETSELSRLYPIVNYLISNDDYHITTIYFDRNDMDGSGYNDTVDPDYSDDYGKIFVLFDPNADVEKMFSDFIKLNDIYVDDEYMSSDPSIHISNVYNTYGGIAYFNDADEFIKHIKSQEEYTND